MFQPSETVVHLRICRDDLEIAIGSGVLYKKDEKSYIITAWHNLSGRHSETLEPLSKNLIIPNKIIATLTIHFSYNNEKSYFKLNFTLPLDKNGKSNYYIHPQGWPKVDVAAIPIDLNAINHMEGYTDDKKISIPFTLSSFGKDTHIIHIQDLEFKYKNITDYSEYLYASEDVFIIGYPKGIVDHTMQPLWKRATVASNPQLGWHQQNQFLVDCASKEGMSGAPAFFYNLKGQALIGNTQLMTSSPITIFHGIYVGRIGSTNEFEAQIGRVWKRIVIDEIIDNGQLDYPHDELILPDSIIIETIEKQWPADGKDYASKILKFFLQGIMHAINGRANYHEVEKLIIAYAKKFID